MIDIRYSTEDTSGQFILGEDANALDAVKAMISTLLIVGYPTEWLKLLFSYAGTYGPSSVLQLWSEIVQETLKEGKE